MTDLDKFKQLFSTCSIFRGGGVQQSSDGVLPQYRFNIAVDTGKGYNRKYVDLLAEFNDAGEWVRTVEPK